MPHSHTHSHTQAYTPPHSQLVSGRDGGMEGQMKANDNCNVGLAYVNVSTLNVNYSLPNHTYTKAHPRTHPHKRTHSLRLVWHSNYLDYLGAKPFPKLFRFASALFYAHKYLMRPSQHPPVYPPMPYPCSPPRTLLRGLRNGN